MSIVMVQFRSLSIFFLECEEKKAVNSWAKKLIEEKACEPEYVSDEKGTCLNRKKMPLYAIISKDEKHHGLRHPRADHFTSVDATKHYYCLKNKPYIELYVKKCLQRYKGENSSYQL